MSQRSDLSRYYADNDSVLCVGWLDRNINYPRGTASQEFRKALTEHVRYSVIQSIGFHRCTICCEAGHDVRIQYEGGRLMRLGSCEIRVFAENEITYAAPNLIHHYVMDCEYLPPESFIEAVIKSPRPPSDDYIALLARHSATRFACPLVDMATGKPIWLPPRFFPDKGGGEAGPAQ
jgi:hypothetical protein